MEAAAFAIFCLLVLYVCYWAIKNDDGERQDRPGKRFDPSGRGTGNENKEG